MDARELRSPSSRAGRRLTHLAVSALAVMLGWALWRGYGVWLLRAHVH